MKRAGPVSLGGLADEVDELKEQIAVLRFQNAALLALLHCLPGIKDIDAEGPREKLNDCFVWGNTEPNGLNDIAPAMFYVQKLVDAEDN